MRAGPKLRSAPLLAEAGRRWLGEMRGNPVGENLRESSRRWMTDQGVKNPDRFAHLIAPGFACPQPDCQA